MELNEKELIHIKKIILESYVCESKYKTYMENAEDPYLKEFYLKLSNQAVQNRQCFLQFFS